LGESAQGEDRGVSDKPQKSDELTARERQVLVLIAAGMSSRQIAEKLGVAFKTVVVHRHNIHKKLGVHNAVLLTRFAIRKGLVKA